jgi:hypothetical protein
MRDISSNPQIGLDWEDVCLDPHHDSLQQGRALGREAAAVAGFRDGEALGRIKGVEFGLEIGFYRGIVKVLCQDAHTERIQNSLDKLRHALDDFPSPDELFLESDSTVLDAMKFNAMDDDSEAPSRFDILSKMQRIRAYYKLLTVQVGKPLLSLRNVLERSMSKTEGFETGDNGW